MGELLKNACIIVCVDLYLFGASYVAYLHAHGKWLSDSGLGWTKAIVPLLQHVWGSCYQGRLFPMKGISGSSCQWINERHGSIEVMHAHKSAQVTQAHIWTMKQKKKNTFTWDQCGCLKPFFSHNTAFALLLPVLQVKLIFVPRQSPDVFIVLSIESKYRITLIHIFRTEIVLFDLGSDA